MASMMDLLLAVEMVMTTTLVSTMTFTWMKVYAKINEKRQREKNREVEMITGKKERRGRWQKQKGVHHNKTIWLSTASHFFIEREIQQQISANLNHIKHIVRKVKPYVKQYRTVQTSGWRSLAFLHLNNSRKDKWHISYCWPWWWRWQAQQSPR